MFTGIIEEIAEVIAIERNKSNVNFTFRANMANALKVDQSLAHNGCCLTVVEQSEMEYKVHYCQKSLEKKGLPTIEEYDFNTWEHIDFEASDFDTKKTNNIKEQIDETD